jgi:3-deoxy-D-manno-octulosonic-acid transferase
VERAGLRGGRRSALGAGPWDGDVLLLDTLGELARAYSLATVVFVGGSLMPAGGHNVLEAAAAGVPVVVGPHMENFQEIADELRAEGGLLTVSSAEELGREVAGLLADPARRDTLAGAARRMLERNRGALARTVDAVAALLGQPSPPRGGRG